jgi:2-polyprenyl-6-methoxyphenol hydroxylase-like FAD-dependent oxidoreductase
VSTQEKSDPIVIAGAGPVGLFSACLLVNLGYQVIVLESETTLSEDMRASTFHPATLELLDPLGLADPLVEAGTPADRWQYMIHGTQERAVFDLSVISDFTRFPYRLQCEQFRLTRLIKSVLQDHPLFDLRFEHELVNLSDQGESVTATVKGPDGLMQIQTPWLIAADGGKSTARKSLALDFEGSVFPKTSITLVLDYPFQDHVPDLLDVNYVWTSEAHYSLMRIRDLWRFSYSPDQDQTVEEALSAPVAQAHLQSVFPRSQDYALLQRNYYTLSQRCLESFRVGRVLFAGDSAHLNSPSGGMGMNSGLHDAQCLVDHLHPVLQGENDELLDRYDRRRRTIATDEVQRLSAKNYRLHRETDPVKREEIWQGLQATVNDTEKMRSFLLDASLIRSRQRELEIS